MTSPPGALARRLTDARPDYTSSAFISGAGSGIGRALTLTVLDRGYHVFAGAYNDAEESSLAESFDARRVTPIVLDVRDEASTQAAATIVGQNLAGIKLKAVCNIAGVIVNGPLVDLSGAALSNVLAVNLVGVHNVTRSMLPVLGPGSRVVNMSSASGVRTLPFTGAYSASKFGLEALTAAMRMEFAPLGIRVSAVAPGMVRTPMADEIQQQLRRPPSLEVYAEPVRIVLAKSVASVERGIPMRRVVATIVSALESTSPSPRYDLHHSWAQDAVLMRMVPTKGREAVVARVLHLTPTP